MIDIMNDFMVFFGLNYTPATFPELFKWLVCVLIGVALVISIIRAMFWMTAKIGGRKW